MRKILKNISEILLALILIWILLSLVWFAWSRKTYSKYTDGMVRNELSNFIVPRYYTEDEDYTYFVKYPFYMSLTGNLAVTSKNEESGVVALLIWPKLNGDKEYGLIINEGSVQYQIYNDSSGKAVDKEYEDIVEKHNEEVVKIIKAAEAVWGE